MKYAQQSHHFSADLQQTISPTLTTQSKMKSIIYYHDHCTDGFGAAFVVSQALDGVDTEYVACSYNTEPPALEQYKDSIVFIVDFSFPLDVMKSIFENAAHTTWLDHHKTAFEMYGKDVDTAVYESNDKYTIVLDNSRSGAMLAFNHFFHSAQDLPPMIQHIDDRDRWQFRIPGSREFHVALQLMKPWSFKQWAELDILMDHNSESYDAFIELGALLLKNEKRQIQSASERPRPCSILGFQGLAVNSTVHMSEIGHELANQSGTFGLVYYIDSDNSVKCSLRSNGDYDVSVKAKEFGGGGHKNAAGFTTSLETLQQFLS